MTLRLEAWGRILSATEFALTSCVRSSANEPGPPASEVARPGSVDAAEITSQTSMAGWQLGAVYAYTAKLTSTVAFGDQPNPLELNLESRVEVIPIEVTTEAITIHVAMRGPDIESGTAGRRDGLHVVARELEESTCFFVLSGGRVREMRVPRGLSAIAANTYRSLGAGLQFSRSTDNANRYSATEYDAMGKYEAQYQQAGARHLWHKRKERYLELLGPSDRPANAPAAVVPKVVASEGSIRLTADGRPEEVSLRDEVEMRGSQVAVHSTSSLLLQPAPTEPFASTRQESGAAAPSVADLHARFRQADRIAADQPYAVESSPEALDDARIGGLSFSDVVSSLESMDKEKPSTATDHGGAPDQGEIDVQKRARLFIALCAILRKKPDAIGLAVAKIRARSPAASVLISALGSASNPAAERALLELSRSKSIGDDLKSHVINALGQTRRPSVLAVEGLKAMLAEDPFSPRVLYGLGTYARHLRDQGKTEEAVAIGELLLARLQAASTSSSLITVLRAIANSGYRPALAKLMPHLEDPRHLVRAAAVRAVQSMPGSEPEDVIASRLQHDTSVEVRLSAIAAARARAPSDQLVRALVDAATSADSPHVRYGAVETMCAWLAKRPDLRGSLLRVANGDQEVRIRQRTRACMVEPRALGI
jgi:hypothetical protein